MLYAQSDLNRYPGRSLSFGMVLLILSFFVVPRLFQLGHILSWDEAWNLCALKSLAGHGTLFLEQYFRHPPIYMEIGRQLSPLIEGFEIRMELLSLFLNSVTFILLLLLVADL